MHKYLLLTLLSFPLFADDTPQEEAALEEVHLETPGLIEPSIYNQQLQVPEEPRSKVDALIFPHKSSFITVGLSSLIPGLGHIYLGDLVTGGSLFTTYGLTAFNWLRSDNEFTYLSRGIIAQNTWFYNVFASYRDVRLFNGPSGYSYQMPRETLSELSLAPFQLSILKKKEVWGGLLGLLTAALLIDYAVYPKDAHIHLNYTTSVPSFFALPIGIGEEAFFRGYMQSIFSEYFNDKIGMALSSIVFGAVHISNAKLIDPSLRSRYYSFGIPFITLGGLYFSLITNKNHSLKESVAVHTLYDFTLFLLESLSTSSLQPHQPKTFAISFAL